MERDPDYIDPEVLEARARRSGGAGAKVAGSRPRVRRPEEKLSEFQGIRFRSDGRASVLITTSHVVESNGLPSRPGTVAIR